MSGRCARPGPRRPAPRPASPSPSSCRCWSRSWSCGTGCPAAAEHTGTDRAGVTELAADAARLAGEPERGLTLVEAALGELGESGDPGRRASLLLRRAVLRQQALLPGPVDDLQTALRLARSPDRLRAEILGQLSRALSLRGR